MRVAYVKRGLCSAMDRKKTEIKERKKKTYLQPLNLISFSTELGQLIDAFILYDRGVHIEADAVSCTEQFLDALLWRHHADGHQR